MKFYMKLLDKYLKNSNAAIIFSSLNHTPVLLKSDVVSEKIMNQAVCYATDLSSIDENGDLRSIWLDASKKTYDVIVISHTMLMYHGSFFSALMTLLFDMLEDGGSLIVPLGNAKGHERTIDDFENFFGVSGVVLRTRKSRHYVIFDKTEVTKNSIDRTALSVLNWYKDGVKDILFDGHRQNAAYQTVRNGNLSDVHAISPALAEYVTSYNPENIVNSLRVTDTLSVQEFLSGEYERSVDVEPAILKREVNAQSYSVGCMRYKSTIISHIIKSFMDGKPNLHLTDLGGGYGNLAAEILMDDVNTVTDVLVNDPSVRYMLFSEYMYRGLNDVLKDHFEFQLGLMEDHEFTSTDIISMIGSVLFVPREQRADFIKRAFDSLRPGGLLIIHENIRAERFAGVKEHDHMLGADELDGYLSPLSKVNYFSSTYWAHFSREEAGTKSVFRVVQKTS